MNKIYKSKPITFLFKTQKGNRILSLSVLLIIMVLILSIINFNINVTSIFPPCSFKKITGFNCLTCGATRSFQSLMSGKIIESIKYNPLFIIVLIGLIIFLIYFILNTFKKEYKPIKLNLSGKVLTIIIITIFAFIITRNFNFYKIIFY